jgi:hypothetical protein
VPRLSQSNLRADVSGVLRNIMTASLSLLPTELLLKIIESESVSREQKNGFKTLRATCVEINAKIGYFFAAGYLNNIKFKLDEAGFLQSQALSKHPLRIYVQSITIEVTTLFEEVFLENTSDTTDASLCSWYTTSALNVMDAAKCVCTFSGSVANFIVDGSCSHMLTPALSQFLKLKSFHIAPPSIMGDMVAKKLREVESRWLVASKILFAAAYNTLPIPLSVLDMSAIYRPKWSSSLQKLQLNLVNDLQEGKI